jgi:uncharacterized membrane protein
MVLLIILAGSVVRFVDLDRMPVWHDEAFSALRVFGHDERNLFERLYSADLLRATELQAFQHEAPELGWPDTLRALRLHPEHSPLYYAFARLLGGVMESPLLALRGGAALFGVLLAPAMFWLARELFDSGRTPWIAAALAAGSPLFLLYAQEAREYALWLAVMAGGSAALLRALRLERRRDWALYAFLVTVGLYSHLLFALLLPVHGTTLYGTLGNDPARLKRALPAWLSTVGIGLLLFSPWLYQLLAGAERVGLYTAWMARAQPPAALFAAWGRHLAHLFVDLPTLPPAAAWAVDLLLVWAMWRCLPTAPRRAQWFLWPLLAVSVATTLAPDLLLGGSRSLHARYLLPTLLAVLMMVAQAIAGTWGSPARWKDRTAGTAFALLLALGAWSDLEILRADTWWTKYFSSANAEVARIINASPHPLIVVGHHGVAPGEMLSLSYYLDQRVRVWGEPERGADRIPGGFASLFLLTPSEPLRAMLQSDYQLQSLAGTWQWFRAVPRQSGTAPKALSADAPRSD